MFRTTAFSFFALTFAACSSGDHDHSSHDHGPQDSTVSAGAKPYPLDRCVVSGEKLGSMGAPTRIVHEGQEIKFCCPGCRKDFDKDTQKFMRKIAESSR